MQFNRQTFFAYARRAPFGGKLTQGQVDGCNAILDEWDRRGLSDVRQLAYLLATPFHETGGKMQPGRENMNYTAAGIMKTFGAGKHSAGVTAAEAQKLAGHPQDLANRVYGTGAMARKLGNTGPNDGWLYRGDGLPMLTGKGNFIKFSVSPGMDLQTAVRVMFDGMLGDSSGNTFTGRRLSEFFSAKEDPEGARATVNGSDKKALIAGYYRNFLDALRAASTLSPQPTDVKPEDAKPDDVPATQSVGVMGAVTTGVAGLGGLGALGSISNLYALGAFALVFTAACIFAWLYLSGRITINRRPA